MSGDWRLQNMTLVDREGNRRTFSGTEIESLGLPTAITVS